MEKNNEVSVITNEEPRINLPEDLRTSYSGSIALTDSQKKAWNIIATGKIPNEAIRERAGTKGKKFKYVDHVWITELMRSAFGPKYQTEVLDYSILSDGSAVARVAQTILIPKNDNEFYSYRVVEVGSCRVTNGMSMADRILSAASRAVARCAFRSLGIGAEFYDSKEFDESMSPDDAWTSIKLYVSKYPKNITLKDVVEFCRSENITSESIIANLEKIWAFIDKKIKESRSGGSNIQNDLNEDSKKDERTIEKGSNE